MMPIIEDSIRRKIQLVDSLLHSDDSLSLDDLTKFLDISKSTLQRDIELINEKFATYILIEQDLNQVSIADKNAESIYYLETLLLNSSSNIKLLSEFMQNPFNKVKTYADKLKTSASNIYKTIKKINVALAPYDIEIINVQNKYFIEAKYEITLRRLFSVYWLEIHDYQSIHFFKNNQEFERVKQTLTTELPVYSKITLTQNYYHSFVYLSLIREKQGFSLQKARFPEELTNKNSGEIILDSLTYSPFKENPLLNSRRLNALREFLEDTFHDTSDALLFYEFLLLIYKNKLTDEIPAHLFVNKYHYFYQSLKKNSHLFQPVDNLIQQLEIILSANLSQYSTLISYVIVVYFPEFLEAKDKKTVYVYSQLSTSHGQFLQMLLENKFNKLYTFIVIEDKSFIKENQDHFLFVTNDNSIKLDNNFIINDYPKRIDLTNLQKKLSNFHFA